MKNLFSLNAETGDMPENKYIVKKTDAAVSDRQAKTLKRVNEFKQKYSLPWYFKVIMYVCGIAAAIIFCGVLRACGEGTSLSKGYHNAPYLFYIFGACLIIFLILFVMARYLDRKGGKDPELQLIAQEIENTVSESFESLGVPAEAAEISVIAYIFKIKKGKEKPASPFMKFNVHEMKIYSDEEKIYLADIDCVTAIPFSDVKQISENKKRIQFNEWTKNESFRSKKYKPYKIRAFQYGFSVKTYSLRINSGGAEAEIIIPNYDLEILKNYVTAPVIELKQKKKTKQG